MDENKRYSTFYIARPLYLVLSNTNPYDRFQINDGCVFEDIKHYKSKNEIERRCNLYVVSENATT